MTKKLVGFYPLSRHNETFDIRKSFRFHKSQIMLYLLENPLSSKNDIYKAEINSKRITKNHSHLSKCLKDLVNYECVLYLPLFKTYVVNSPNQRKDKLYEIFFCVFLNGLDCYLKRNKIHLPYFSEQILPYFHVNESKKRQSDYLKKIKFTKGIDPTKPLLDQILIKLICLIQLSETTYKEQIKILFPTEAQKTVNEYYANLINPKSIPFIETDYFRYFLWFRFILENKDLFYNSVFEWFSNKLDEYYGEDEKFSDKIKKGRYLTVKQKLMVAEEYFTNDTRGAKKLLVDILSQIPSQNNFQRLESAKSRHPEISHYHDFQNYETDVMNIRKKDRYNKIQNHKNESRVQNRYKNLIKKSINLDDLFNSIIDKNGKLNLKEIQKELAKERNSFLATKITLNDLFKLLNFTYKN